jgi:5'-3' exonuclease
VRILYPQTGVSKLVVVDEAEIGRRYGIPGRAYGDFAILRGDPSDGLPGVPGIGEKTASRLLAEHGSLAAVLAARSLPAAVARRLEAAAAYLDAARRVVLPVTDVPLPTVDLTLPARPAHPRRLAALAAEHELGTPVQRVEAALAALASDPRSG